MKKGFKSPKLMAILMAVLMSVNSMPVTAFADEADLKSWNSQNLLWNVKQKKRR